MKTKKPPVEHVEETPRLDARQLDHNSYIARLRSLGLDTSYQENHHANERERVSPQVTRANATDHAAEQRRRDEHVKALPAFDGRTASVADVRARLNVLGISPVGFDLLDPNRPASGSPPQEPPLASSAFTADPSSAQVAALARASEAERTLAAKVTAAAKAGRTVHATELSDDEFRIYMRKRGLAVPGGASLF